MFVTIEDETGDMQFIRLGRGLRPMPEGAGEPGARGPGGGCGPAPCTMPWRMV